MLDPEVPVIPLAQNTDSGIFTGYWNIENLDSSANTYMITSDQKSDISIKPFILCKDKAFESLSDFHKKIIISDIVSVNSGSTITCSSDDLETYLISGLHSYKSELWKDIGDLKQVFATQNISLTALKLWQVLCSNEFLLARLLLFCSSERIIMQKIRDELISVPAIISFATWEAAITEYLQYLREAFAKIPGMESMLKSMISEQFKVLTDTFPEIEVTVYYLLFKISCNFTDMIEFNCIIPHVGKAINFTEQQLSDEIFTKNKYDENDEIEELCWMQTLQAQNSLEEDNWIPLPFPQLYQEIQSMYNALNTQIILCVNEKTLGDDVKKTISLLSNLSNVSVKAIPEKLNDKIMAIVWDGFKYYSYASFDENVRQLNQYWGSNINTSILSGYIDINGLKFNDVKLETVENISYDKMFNISSEVNGPGYGFGNRLLSILASSLDKGISSPIVKIEYKDRYLKNPLASGLFYSFIKELKVRYEKLWNCASITLETAETTKTNKQYPTMFYHDWDDVDARNEVLTALFDKIELKFQLKEKNKKYLEHNRIMTIELENGEKINLILDQGFSYWRCLAYCYAENIFPFDADIDEQVAKIGQWLPNVSGDTYPTRIFYTKSK